MKPLMLMCVPPAQAEALYDTQDDLRDDLRLDDRVTRLPWRDDESSDEPLSYTLSSHSLPSSTRITRQAGKTPSFGQVR